jgi:ketosteroid isomerase-like protein
MSEGESEVVAEVTRCFTEYESALVRGDVAAMTASFSDRADLVRFGIADMQRGPSELTAWRERQPPLPPGRTLHDTVVSTFGDDAAVVTTLFSYPGRPKLGRQSQTWIRYGTTWRIVHAHVSEVDVDVDDSREGVSANAPR